MGTNSSARKSSTSIGVELWNFQMFGIANSAKIHLWNGQRNSWHVCAKNSRHIEEGLFGCKKSRDWGWKVGNREFKLIFKKIYMAKTLCPYFCLTL
jgi:hypothetical protein